MKSFVRIMSLLVLLAGVGHIYLALGYDNPTMKMQMLGGGSIYLVLGVLVWFNKKTAMILSSAVMLMATISSGSMLNDLGYPIIILRGFLVINVLMIIMTIMYFIHNRRLRNETI